MKARPIKVDEIEDTGYLIQGTDDPEVARSAVWDWLVAAFYVDPDQEADVRWFAVRHPLTKYRVGWFRKNPCGPNWCGDHGWHLADAEGPGAGIFRAVLAEVY